MGVNEVTPHWPGAPLRHHVSGGIFAHYCPDLDIHGSFLGWLGFTGGASSITNITHLLEALKYVVEYPGSSSILLNRTYNYNQSYGYRMVTLEVIAYKIFTLVIEHLPSACRYATLCRSFISSSRCASRCRRISPAP